MIIYHGFLCVFILTSLVFSLSEHLSWKGKKKKKAPNAVQKRKDPRKKKKLVVYFPFGKSGFWNSRIERKVKDSWSLYPINNKKAIWSRGLLTKTRDFFDLLIYDHVADTVHFKNQAMQKQKPKLYLFETCSISLFSSLFFK